MADELRVIPDLLNQVGNALENSGLSLLTMQQACHHEAEGARSGWVGSSASALTVLLDRWEMASAAQINRFGAHSCGMHFAAAECTELEQHNTAVLAQVYAVHNDDRRSAR